MPRKLKTFWIKVRKPLLYITLIAVIKLFIEEHHFSLFTYILLSLFFIIPELISEYKPEYLAFFFVQRRLLVGIVLLLCTLPSVYFYSRYPFPDDFFIDNFAAIKYMLSVLLQGGIVGLVTRMLVLSTFYQMIRARDVYISKVLILVVYTVFLTMLPVKYMYFISFYILGFGLGFLIHYLSRISERRNASYSRLRQNLLSMIESLKKEAKYKLTLEENKAVNQYANQKWGKLNRLLNLPESEVLFFIKLCMHRKLHQYNAALYLLDEKERQRPDWYKRNEQFFYLHRALNQNDKTDNKDDVEIKATIIGDLRRAVKIDHSCLLSNASLALKLANEIDLDSEKECDCSKKKEAIKYILRAMNIYEERDKEPRIISFATGMTIPFTYSFLLDTYGYILLKNGNLRFAKALLIQCLYQDPSFSASYLHLAEWYKEYYKNHMNENWIKAARLSLYIAIYNEKVNNKGGNESFISDKAKKILNSL